MKPPSSYWALLPILLMILAGGVYYLAPSFQNAELSLTEPLPPASKSVTGEKAPPPPSLLSQKDPTPIEKATEQPLDPMKQQFQKIANQYQQLIEYPPYSMPLSDKQFDVLEPHYFHPSNRILDATHGVTLSASLGKVLYFQGETLSGQFRIQAPPNQTVPQADAIQVELLEDQQVIATLLTRRESQSANEQVIAFEHLLTLDTRTKWPASLIVRIRFLLYGIGERGATLSFKYEKPVASIREVGDAFVEGSHLTIPVTLNVTNPAKFRVEGVLFSQSTLKPLIHLVARKNLTPDETTLFLQAHIKALQAQEDPGPYLLKTLTIEQIPNTLKERARYGKGSDLKEWEIPRFEWDVYTPSDYVSPMLQKKLRLLQKLSQ